MSARHRPKTCYRHMTPELAAHIRALYFARVGGEQLWKQADLATMYRVRQNTISRIVSRLVWV